MKDVISDCPLTNLHEIELFSFFQNQIMGPWTVVNNGCVPALGKVFLGYHD
jgi:hypothetical protein